MSKSRWKKIHKASGAVVIERHAGGCTLTVVPQRWTHPKGAAHWSVSCTTGEHRRGTTASVKGAKELATRNARSLKRRGS